MAYELKAGQGTIFKNLQKKEDKHPEYRGQIMTPSGQLLDIALWVKEGKKGKFFSVGLSEPRRSENEEPF